MATPHTQDESTVLIRRSELRYLLQAGRRTVSLAYLAGTIAVWAAVVLVIAEGRVTLWVVLFSVLGAALLISGIRTARQLKRRFGPNGIMPIDGPFSGLGHVDRPPSRWYEISLANPFGSGDPPGGPGG
jgi:hypothetical protein